MEDPGWHYEHSKQHQVQAQYSPVFLAYVGEMFSIRDLRSAGFPVARLDLTLTDWEVLVEIDKYFERKRMEVNPWLT